MDTYVTTKEDGSEDLVGRVRDALSGNPSAPAETKTSSKVDGRTKAFKDTLKRIESRRAKKDVVEEETEVNELQYQDSPSYRGGSSVVRGGLAMTDERLGKLRIMMRNIARFEGVGVLADEISDALSSSEINELKRLL